MSKVLVDRELLERAMYANDGKELIAANRELRAILAQPAEVEGVDFGFDDRSVRVSQEAYSIFLARERHHLAALSAVTAERDRLRKDAERYRWASSGVHEAETLVSIVNCHGGYAEKVAERVDVYREAATAAKEA